MRVYFFLFISIIFGILSCNKKSKVINHQVINTPVSSRINKSFWVNENVGFFCGGEKGDLGYIYKTIDAGKSWVNQYALPGSLYDILFINDSVGYCCGENTCVLKTVDFGRKWNKITKGNNFDNFYNGTLYGINHLNNEIWFFGGKNYNVGFVIKAEGNQMYDGFRGFDNELRCGVIKDANSYLACGYGLCYSTSNNAETFNSVDLGNYFFTGASQLNSSISYLCDFNGNVIRYNFDSNSSSQIFKLKKKIKKNLHFNGIYFSSESAGWVVGNDGVFASTQNGNTFDLLNLNTNDNLLSVVWNKQNDVIISTNTGKLIVVSR